MTSFGAKQITEGPFMPTFKGQVYHLIGSLLADSEPRFLQIYFVSDYTELNMAIFPSLIAYIRITEHAESSKPICAEFQSSFGVNSTRKQ